MVGAIEALEQPGELLLVDADAVVGAAQDDRVALRSTASTKLVPGPA